MSIDVCSFYTNILYNEGLKAVETTLKRKNLQAKVIINFLELILKLNNWIFLCTNFLQLKGCAMARKYAPNTGKYLCGYIWRNTHLSVNQTMPLNLRYIDDIFFIWTGSGNELQQLMSKFSDVKPSIKLDFNYSKTQIHFLDIPIKNKYRKTFNNTIQKKFEQSHRSNLIFIENQSTLKLLNEAFPICKRCD